MSKTYRAHFVTACGCEKWMDIPTVYQIYQMSIVRPVAVKAGVLPLDEAAIASRNFELRGCDGVNAEYREIIDLRLFRP